MQVQQQQQNTGAKLLNVVDQSIVGVGGTTTPNTNKIENLTHSLNNPAVTVASIPIQQQNMLPHVMDNTKKMNQEQFVDKQKHTGHQQHQQQQQQQQNYQMQQQMNHLNIQKPQQKPYEPNMLMQRDHQQNMNNHQQQQHYQQPQHQHQLSVNSNLSVMKDSNSSQNISGTSSGNNSQLLNISPQNIAAAKNNQPIISNSNNNNNETSSPKKVQSVSAQPIFNIGNSLSFTDIEQQYPNGDPSEWNVDQVYQFIKCVSGVQVAELFKAQEVDGSALSLIRDDHLVNTMQIKLGPALKIMSRVNDLKSKINTVK